MRRVLAFAAVVIASPALAQGSLTPPAAEPRLRDLGAEAEGEQQARFRLGTDGYHDVTTLLRGSDGRWHGKAVRDGRTVDVTVDAVGNVRSE